MQKEPMTKVGYDKLVATLEDLKINQLPEVVKEIEVALEHGDLKENAEYHAAKDKQKFLNAKVGEISNIIANAQVIDPASLAHEKVSFGSTVKVVDLDDEKELEYSIVGSVETNPDKKRISFYSPLARALVGKEEGDVVEVNVGGNVKEYEIEQVYYKEIDFE